MAKYLDKSQWEDQILIPDEQTPILGGQPEWDSTNMLSGWSNVPTGMLADRTRFLHDRIQEIEQDIEQGAAGSLKRDNNLSDLQDVGQARFNLELNLVDNVRDVDKPVSTATQAALNTKVDKVVGKGLSDENYTLAEKNKLGGVQAGAQVNSVTSVAGKTGAVLLTKADVSLSNVDNTADSVKNVASATKLTTSRSINGTSFDGTADIVTSNWGAWRTLTIGTQARNVNGSGNVSWSLAEIGAASTVHTHTSSDITDATSVGQSLLTAADAVSARTAIGAGTSNLAIGTTSTTAKAGNWQPTSASKAQVLDGTDNVYVSGGSYLNVISWNNIGSISTNTSINLDTSLNHSLTATASLTLDAINVDPGKTGDIIISTPTAVTISWNTQWKFLGSVPNIGGAGETWVVSYKVVDASNIYASAAKVA